MKKYFYLLASSFFLLFNISCEKNLQREPQTALSSDGGFKTPEDVRAAIFGCYSALQSANYMGLRYWLFADMNADNISHTGTFPTFGQIFNKSILADNVELLNMWTITYSGINRTNNVIFYSETLNDPAFKKNEAIGEARFLRAFHYFNLLRYFGGSNTGFNKPGGLGIPLILKPTLNQNDAQGVPRATEAEVWKQIIEDLDFAITNLPMPASGRVSPAQAGKVAAQALKARALLYRGEWASAETLASEIIANKGYALSSSYASIFSTKNSAEAIFELQFDINNTNAIAFFYFPSPQGRNEVTSSSTLSAAHEANDARKVVNVSTSPANKTQKYFRLDGTDNVVLMRLGEIYLIRAEARAKSGKLAEGIADLNVIRKRAGLPDNAAASTTQLVDDIIKERRIELAHEGHRFFDLKRSDKLSFDETNKFKALWPIPLREIQTVGKEVLNQNPGY